MFSHRNLEKMDNAMVEKDYFLSNSYHFKELKRIDNRMQTEDDKKFTSSWIISFENAKDLYDILYSTRDLDPAGTDTLLVYQLGRTKWNAILFVAGCVYDRANFSYHLLHLRESIQSYLEERRPKLW